MVTCVSTSNMWHDVILDLSRLASSLLQIGCSMTKERLSYLPRYAPTSLETNA